MFALSDGGSGLARRILRLTLLLSGILGVSWVALGYLFAPAEILAGIPRSTALYARDGTLLRLTCAADGQYRLWTPLSQISPDLVDAVLLHEDQYFRWHPGFNPLALLRAALTGWRGSGKRRGASTVTMQLARRIWRIDSRSPWGKLQQIARAIALEARHDKAAILEAYLNTAPYGGNVEGVGAASLVLFGKPPDRLLLGEALALAVIPQSPTQRGTPLVRNRPAPAPLRAARRRLFARWKARRATTPLQEDLAGAPIATTGLRDLPFLAPHLTTSLLDHATSAAPGDIRTTLDLPLQRLVERHVALRVRAGRAIGIHNAAALLLDARTMEVLALVGSADFFDRSISGQVDGTAAKRSPGSALKPFVYALALDQGVIHAETLLPDTPTSFATYTPENIDGRFVGPISATRALITSRNVPAVHLTGRLNRPGLFGLLRLAGVTDLVSESHYGLGIALGGAEVTLRELATLYAALAHGGRVRPLRLRAGEPRPPGDALFSPEAAFVTLEMLRQTPRPDRPLVTSEARSALRVAWKTGTSWGFRDAWTAGIAGPYVLVAWVGDFRSRGNPAYAGLLATAPLFFALVDALAAERPAELRTAPDPPPAGAKRIELCARSGALPGPHCSARKRGWFIPGRSPIDVCAVHQEITLDARTGRRVCAPTARPVRRVVIEVWPSDWARLLAAAGVAQDVPPPGPGCEPSGTLEGQSPRIASPLQGAAYVLRDEQTAPTLALTAHTAGDTNEVFWYVGARLLGRAPSGEPLFWKPMPGRHVLRAVDGLGRSTTRLLDVELVPY